MMNVSHSPLTTWGLEQVVIGPDFVILDVGCGGGATVDRLAAITSDGRVCGIDYADGSVAVSRRKNAALIAAGRVDIRKASVSRLPFDPGTFYLVTAIETHYSADEHRELFTTAGYSDVRVIEHRGRGWICAIGHVPDPTKTPEAPESSAPT